MTSTTTDRSTDRAYPSDAPGPSGPARADGSYLLCGERHAPVPGRGLEVRSPVDGSVVGTVHEFDHDEIDRVFDHVGRHQAAWEDTSIDERSKILHAVGDALEAHADELAELLVMEIAKARKDSRDEVVRTADFVRYTAEEAKRVVGDAQFSDAFPRQDRNKLAISYRVPLGTVLAIPPFNYPINLGLSKVAPGLVTGNVVVLKPPTQGSVVCTRLAEIMFEAGVPHGVLAVVTGRGSKIGDYLVEHPSVDMISFTGSTETGRALAKKAGMVPLLLELGGKDAAIVLEDADLEAAAADIIGGAFAYAGQRCTAVKRVLVSNGVADRLVALLAEKVEAISVGDPRDNCTVIPLIDLSAAERAEELVAQAVSKGARIVAGAGPDGGAQRQGNLLWPVLLDEVTTDMDIAWVEPFAPVLPVIRVANAADAVRIANESEYGLQAAIFSSDVDAAMVLSLRLDVGTVQVNGKTARGPDHFPFVGAKSSGMGAQGVRYSIEAMTRLKSMVFNMRQGDLTKIR
ncbi:MAG: aldehyde dehydrogenase family protein [Acidimicrobiales bacterium]